MGSVGTYLINTKYDDLTKNAFSNKQAIASLAATTLNEKLGRSIDIGNALATRVQFGKLVDSGQWDEAIEIMASVPKSFPFIDMISVLNSGGVLEALTPSTPETSTAVGKDFSDQDYYQGVSKNWKPYVSEAFNYAVGPKYGFTAIAIPIKSDPDAKIIGVLVFDIRLDTLITWSKNLDLGLGGVINIVDQKGQLVSNSTILQDGKIVDYSSAPSVQKVLNGERGIDVFFNPVENKEMLTAYEPIPDYGWGITVTQPASSAFAERDRSVKNDIALWAFIIIFLEAGIFLLLRSRNTVKKKLDNEKVLLDKLKLNAETLELANKDLEAFSYSVSHDLRAPLRAVSGFAQILVEDYDEKLDDGGKHVVTTIRKSAEQMGNLIDDLLAFSRLGRQEIRATDVDMTRLAKTVFDELKLVSPERSIQFTCTELPVAHVDPALIRQVWMNLLSNAIKFTSTKDIAIIAIGGTIENDVATYSVKDNGVGFDMKYVAKLFTVFQRLHSVDEFEGTGIGLSIVARIINKHGGKVWAEGMIDQGTTFYFSLPKIS